MNEHPNTDPDDVVRLHHPDSRASVWDRPADVEPHPDVAEEYEAHEVERQRRVYLHGERARVIRDATPGAPLVAVLGLTADEARVARLALTGHLAAVQRDMRTVTDRPSSPDTSALLAELERDRLAVGRILDALPRIPG